MFYVLAALAVLDVEVQLDKLALFEGGLRKCDSECRHTLFPTATDFGVGG